VRSPNRGMAEFVAEEELTQARSSAIVIQNLPAAPSLRAHARVRLTYGSSDDAHARYRNSYGYVRNRISGTAGSLMLSFGYVPVARTSSIW
jgi:hypothetical protein